MERSPSICGHADDREMCGLRIGGNMLQTSNSIRTPPSGMFVFEESPVANSSAVMEPVESGATALDLDFNSGRFGKSGDALIDGLNSRNQASTQFLVFED